MAAIVAHMTDKWGRTDQQTNKQKQAENLNQS